MKANFEKVPIWHFPPDFGPAICTGYYFRRLQAVPETVPDGLADDLAERLLASTESGPDGSESGPDGGSKVPAPKPPHSPTPISGIAKPLPKILRP